MANENVCYLTRQQEGRYATHAVEINFPQGVLSADQADRLVGWWDSEASKLGLDDVDAEFDTKTDDGRFHVKIILRAAKVQVGDFKSLYRRIFRFLKKLGIACEIIDIGEISRAISRARNLQIFNEVKFNLLAD